MLSIGFRISCRCRGFRHRSESDLLLFLFVKYHSKENASNASVGYVFIVSFCIFLY